jgi:hypothetical protein
MRRCASAGAAQQLRPWKEVISSHGWTLLTPEEHSDRAETCRLQMRREGAATFEHAPPCTVNTYMTRVAFSDVTEFAYG